MKNWNVLLVLTFLFFCQIGTSQINPDLITMTRGKYYYQGEIYFLKRQLVPIYKTNPKAYRAHRNYINTRRAHRVLILASGGALIGLREWRKGRPPGCSGCHPDFVDFFVTIGVWTGSAVLVVGSGLSVYKRSDRALKVFNEEVLSSTKVGAIPPSINIQTSQNGIGLVLNF